MSSASTTGWGLAGRHTLLALVIGVPTVSALAVLAPEHGELALGLAAAALVAAMLLRGTQFFVVAAVPAVWLSEIVRLAGGALSVADAFLIVGTLAALPRLKLGDTGLRSALLLVAGFEAVQLVALVHTLTPYATQELLHRLLLLGGGLMIGAALALSGRLTIAMRLFTAGAGVIALLSIIFAAGTRFAPAYPLLNKNYAGDLLAAAVLLALFAPGDMLALQRWRAPVVLLLAGGLAATQSRGAILGLGCGLVVYALFRRRFDALSVFLVLAAVVGVALFAVLFSGQAAIEQQQQYGALFYRQQDVQQAMEAWQLSPLIGVGIRFWESGLYALRGDPHNVLALTLAESGVVGVLAFTIMLGGLAALCIRARTQLAIVALALLAARLVHGLFDIYWVHGSLVLPWMVTGAALGTASVSRLGRHVDESRATNSSARHSAQAQSDQVGISGGGTRVMSPRNSHAMASAKASTPG